MNVRLDGCCDHRAIERREDNYFQATIISDRADATLLGCMTHGMMRGALREPMPVPVKLSLIDASRHLVAAERRAE